MCYNVSSKSSKEILAERFEAEFSETDELNEYYHVSGFAHPKIPVIRSGQSSLIQSCTWGLIPAWVKDESQAGELMKMTLNAKAETVFEKPSFKYSVKRD